MTPDEREQLGRFIRLLTEAQAGPKDAEAEALIRDACARQPDAGYLLVQRTMQLEYALQAAQSEGEKLKRELAQARTGLPASSFLGSPNAWGHHAIAPAAPAAASQLVSQPASHPAMSRAGQPAPAAAAPASSWGSGLMGTVAMTAAGVVAGSLLYQGIGSLMGRHNNDQGHDKSATPPGDGTVDNTNRYGDSSADQSADSGYAAEDFDTSDAGGFGDSGGDVG